MLRHNEVRWQGVARFYVAAASDQIDGEPHIKIEQPGIPPPQEKDGGRQCGPDSSCLVALTTTAQMLAVGDVALPNWGHLQKALLRLGRWARGFETWEEARQALAQPLELSNDLVLCL